MISLFLFIGTEVYHVTNGSVALISVVMMYLLEADARADSDYSNLIRYLSFFLF